MQELLIDDLLNPFPHVVKKVLLRKGDLFFRELFLRVLGEFFLDSILLFLLFCGFWGFLASVACWLPVASCFLVGPAAF